MELLPSGQSNSVQVLWEDQQNINRFSSLINEKDELKESLEKLKTEKDYLDDLSLEMELLDEDENIQYKIGDVFVFLKIIQAVERVDADNEVLTGKIESLETKIEELDSQLVALKSVFQITKMYLLNLSIILQANFFSYDSSAVFEINESIDPLTVDPRINAAIHLKDIDTQSFQFNDY
ncbi:hypothetical protein PSN45_003841 [Yamadazyma tenuis]|uniref:uncharacterized protein n=1 Tax=Candida tenuis TaxID=2315449 RepID=UPI002799535A|nr:hypothetical protein PSN45_003841 [Yamadazyma tenuis]